MTIYKTIRAIEALRDEADEAGDGETYEQCCRVIDGDYILRDADDAKPLTSASLHIDAKRYVALVIESLDSACGPVVCAVNGRPPRRVYAS